MTITEVNKRLQSYLDDSHPHSKANAILYDALQRENLSEKIYSKYGQTNRKNITNYLVLLIFDAGYELKSKFDTADCPQLCVEEFFYEACDKLNGILEADYSTSNNCHQVFAAHAMGVAFALESLNYERYVYPDDCPPELRYMIFCPIGIIYDQTSYKNIIDLYIRIINHSDWLEWRKILFEKFMSTFERDHELKQKIVVDILKKLLMKHNVPFRTVQQMARFMALITGWKEPTINTLLSKRGQIIPARFKNKVESLNDELKKMGLDITLSTKE